MQELIADLRTHMGASNQQLEEFYLKLKKRLASKRKEGRAPLEAFLAFVKDFERRMQADAETKDHV